MKPKNERPKLLLPDGEGVHCWFMYEDEAPRFWSRCEQWATVQLDEGKTTQIRQWIQENRRAIIGLYPGKQAWLCDTHERVWKDFTQGR
jgi:hypothetical protein